MHRIIYFSQASYPLSSSDLEELVQFACQANQQAGITGALLYGDRQFVQTIEGPKEAVQALYQRLMRDERHAALVKIADHTLPERIYPAQAMTFRELPAPEIHQLIGYLADEYLRTPTVEMTVILRRRLENARAVIQSSSIDRLKLSDFLTHK